MLKSLSIQVEQQLQLGRSLSRKLPRSSQISQTSQISQILRHVSASCALLEPASSDFFRHSSKEWVTTSPRSASRKPCTVPSVEQNEASNSKNTRGDSANMFGASWRVLPSISPERLRNAGLPTSFRNPCFPMRSAGFCQVHVQVETWSEQSGVARLRQLARSATCSPRRCCRETLFGLKRSRIASFPTPSCISMQALFSSEEENTWPDDAMHAELQDAWLKCRQQVPFASFSWKHAGELLPQTPRCRCGLRTAPQLASLLLRWWTMVDAVESRDDCAH